MKSWRTTLAGILAILGTVAPVATKVIQGHTPTMEELMAAAGGVSAGVGLIKAKDAQVTGLPPAK